MNFFYFCREVKKLLRKLNFMKKITNLFSQNDPTRRRGKMAKNFKKSSGTRMTLTLLLLTVASVISSCVKPTRTETMYMKGEEMKSFDWTALKKLLGDKEVVKTLLLLDGKFQNTDETGATWFANNLEDADRTGPGKIDGNKTVYNPTLSADYNKAQWETDSATIVKYNIVVKAKRTNSPHVPTVKNIEIVINDLGHVGTSSIAAYNRMIDSINYNISKYDSLSITLNGKEIGNIDATLGALNLGQFWAIGKTDNKMLDGTPIDNRIPRNVSVAFKTWILETLGVNSEKWKERNLNPDGQGFTPIENPDIEYANRLYETLKANYKVVEM